MSVVGFEAGATESTGGSMTYRRWYDGGSGTLIKQQIASPGSVAIYQDGSTVQYGPEPILPAFPAADSTSATGYPTLPSGYTYSGGGYYMVQLEFSRGSVTGGGYWMDECPDLDLQTTWHDIELPVWRLRAATSPGIVHRYSPQGWHSTADVAATNYMFDSDDFAYPYMTWVSYSGWTSVNDFTGTTYDPGFTVSFGGLAESTWDSAGFGLDFFDYSWPLSLTLRVQPYAEIEHPDGDIYPPPTGGDDLFGLAMDMTPLGGVRQAYNVGFNTTALRLRASDDGPATWSDALLPFTGRSPDVLCLPDGRLWVFEETAGLITGHKSDDDGSTWA